MSTRRQGDAVVRRLVTFGRILREAGIEVGPGRLQDALSALDAIDLAVRDEAYWALRCTLVSRRDDVEVFDAAFAAFWERLSRPLEQRTMRLRVEIPHEQAPRSKVVEAHTVERSAEEGNEDGDDAEDERPAAALFSSDERLREQDFATLRPDELRRLRLLVERVARAAPRRRSLRLEPAHDGRHLDPRRTLRAAMRTGGHPVQREWRRPKQVLRRVVYLVDVSGSMEPYARAMVLFLQAAVRAGRQVDAFTFGTRLTRLTPYLVGRDPDRALQAAAQAVPDWAGGTRIGENLGAFNRLYGRRGLTRGSVVVIVSDGWERGDPRQLGEEMARLHRTAHSVVWVNPLAGHDGYRPLVAGMVAAMPHIDVFLPGHNLRSLEALAEALEAVPATRHRRVIRPRKPMLESRSR